MNKTAFDYDYYCYAVKMYKSTTDETKRAYYKGIIDAYKRNNESKFHSEFISGKYVGKTEKHYA